MKLFQIKLILLVVQLQITVLKSKVFGVYKFLFFRGTLKPVLRRVCYGKKYYDRKIRGIPFIIPKYTGRLGNQLTELSFCLLLSLKYNLPIIIPPRMRVLGLTDLSTYYPLPDLSNLSNKFNIDEIIQRDELTLKFPHNILFHQHNLNLLRSILFPKGLPLLNQEYDVVIHLRLGDVKAEKNKAYKIIPCEYIIKCLEMIFSTKQSELNILFVSEIKNHTDHIFYQTNYYAKLIKLPYIKQIEIQSQAIEDDFKKLMEFKFVIMSVSSFSYWAALLSTNAIQVHVPLFGFTKTEIAAEYWKNTVIKKIILHKI